MNEKINYFLNKYNGVYINDSEIEFDNKFGGKSIVYFYFKENILHANSMHDEPEKSGKFRSKMNMIDLEIHLDKYLKKENK